MALNDLSPIQDTSDTPEEQQYTRGGATAPMASDDSALSFPIYPLDAIGLRYVDSLTLTFLRCSLLR
jgi:hypothetical protein